MFWCTFQGSLPYLPTNKTQICAGSRFPGFHRWISFNSKGCPKSVHCIQAILLCLIKGHPISSFFPHFVLHRCGSYSRRSSSQKKPQRKVSAFLCFSDKNCNCPVWISVSFGRADSQLAVPCFEFYTFTCCISDKLAVSRARWNLPNVITLCICCWGWCRDNCSSGCFTLRSFTS